MAKKSILRKIIGKLSDLQNKVIKINEIDVEVKEYLSINEKGNFINEVIEYCFDEDGLYSSFKKDLFFDYCLVKYFTNLFDNEEFGINEDGSKYVNISERYDLIMRPDFGIFNAIYFELPQEEISMLSEQINLEINEFKKRLESQNTFNSVIKSFLGEITEQMPNLIDTVKNFDPSKLKELQNLMEFANKGNSKG